MKKVLAALLMAALVVASVSAAIDFSGNVVLGYAWSYDTENEKFIEATYGEDGYDVKGFYAQLDATISDENGIVTATLDADSDLDTIGEDGKSHNGAYIGDEMGANVTVDIMKLLGVDSDFSLKLTGTYNDRVTGLRAYKTSYGFANLDRIRTANNGNPLSLDIAYGKLAQLRVAYVFDGTVVSTVTDGTQVFDGENAPGKSFTTTSTDGNVTTVTEYDSVTKTKTITKTTAGTRDFLISALVTPVDGVKVSAGYVLKGNSSAGGQGNGHGGFNVAFDIDIAKLADLDFDLGVSASYVGLFQDDYGQTIAAVVYGGVDAVDAGLEFAYIDEQGVMDDDIFALSLLVNINAVENLPISVYFAIGDLTDAADTIVVGATAEYELNGVGLGVTAEFVTGDSLYYSGADYATGFGVTGFSIAPYVSIAF